MNKTKPYLNPEQTNNHITDLLPSVDGSITLAVKRLFRKYQPVNVYGKPITKNAANCYYRRNVVKKQTRSSIYSNPNFVAPPKPEDLVAVKKGSEVKRIKEILSFGLSEKLTMEAIREVVLG